MSDDALLAPLRNVDEPTRRFSQRVADILNALVRSGAVARSAAAGWQVVATLANGSVTNAKLADMATARLKGRVAAGAGSPQDLTGTQATTLLDTFTSLLKGLAPASGGGTTNFLRADGTWAAPSGGGGGGLPALTPPGAGFTWVNQGSATNTTLASGNVYLTCPAAAGVNGLRLYQTAVSSSTFTAVWGYRPACGVGALYGLIGPCLYDSGSGKLVMVRYGGHESGAGPALSVQQFSSVTVATGDAFAAVDVPEHGGRDGCYFVRVTGDGTTLRYFHGPSPETLVEFFNEPQTTYLPAITGAGFVLNPFSLVAGAEWTHWSLT